MRMQEVQTEIDFFRTVLSICWINFGKSEMSWRELLQVPLYFWVFARVLSSETICLLTAFALALLCWCFLCGSWLSIARGNIEQFGQVPPSLEGEKSLSLGSRGIDLQNATLTWCLVLRKTLIRACCVSKPSHLLEGPLVAQERWHLPFECF